MTGSAHITATTQTSAFEVEELLRCFHAVAANDNKAPPKSRRFNGRPLIATLLAFFVFAPGCAAAAVFLLRNDNVPPVVTPPSNPPIVAKSDRLPLEQWSVEATERLVPQDNVRFAAAVISDDSKFLDSMAIRGSVEDATLSNFAEPAVMDTAVADEPIVAPKPRAKRHARRMAPIRVAEAAEPLPAPPEPGFFEKLFGTRFN